MQNSLHTPYFEYWDEAPHDWPKLLGRLVESGSSEIVVPILWGVHEVTPGMRDFSKQSKLRIERMFSAAQTVGATLKILLGFPPHSLAFPHWIPETEDFELVPSVLWRGEPPYFSLLKVPSPRSNQLKRNFFSFIEEVCSIASLYLSPGGPIKEIELDLFPLKFSQNVYRGSDFGSYLERRYGDVAVVNKRFQTLFKTMSSIATPTGSKLIESKRPWLFAFDFLAAREQIVIDYFEEFLNSAIPDNIKKQIKLRSGSGGTQNRVNKSATVYFESTLIEFGQAGGISPLMIGGQLSSIANQAFQWSQIVAESSRAVGMTLLPLSTGSEAPEQRAAMGIVFCGKYLSKKATEMLLKALGDGSLLFFPMGLPQFDENLDSNDFALQKSKQVTRFSGVDWFCSNQGSGRVFFPVQSNVFSSSKTVSDWIKNFEKIDLVSNNG